MTAIATVVLVCVTAVYVVLTHRLASAQWAQLELSATPLLASRLSINGQRTELHVENAGEHVILDIDAVVVARSDDEGQMAVRHRVAWLPPKVDAPAPRGVATFAMTSGWVLLQFRDARGQQWAQLQFYEQGDDGELETALRPPLGERRGTPIRVGKLTDPQITDEEIDGFPLRMLTDSLKKAASYSQPEARP